jgi:hypothetical protein
MVGWFVDVSDNLALSIYQTFMAVFLFLHLSQHGLYHYLVWPRTMYIAVSSLYVVGGYMHVLLKCV